MQTSPILFFRNKELASLLFGLGSTLSNIFETSCRSMAIFAHGFTFNHVVGVSGGAKCGDSGDEGLHNSRLVFGGFVN